MKARWGHNEAKAWLMRLICLLGLVIVVLVMAGCASNGERVTDFWGSRWFYKCDIPQEWIDSAFEKYAVNVLPWKQFEKAAWAHRINPKDTRAFTQGYAIWLREGYSMDNLYHELAHKHDLENGRYQDHGPTCWTNSKPWEYDSRVRAAFAGLELPKA